MVNIYFGEEKQISFGYTLSKMCVRGDESLLISCSKIYITLKCDTKVDSKTNM